MIELPKLMPDVKSGGMHLWAKYNDQLHEAGRILEESVMDMWLLSKCEYLLYQGNSTFSLISKTLHSNKNKVVDWNA